MFRFVIVTLFSIWVIATGTIALLTPLLDTMLHNIYWSLLIAKIVATIASSVWNYIVYARYVFVETDSP